MRAMRWFLGLVAALVLLAGAAMPAAAQVRPGSYQILGARWGTAQHNVDVTPRIVEIARAAQRLRVDNGTMRVDPDIGAHKTLRIFAREANGNPRTFDIGEGGFLNGAAFAGWTAPANNYGGGYYDWNGPAQAPVQARPSDRGEYQILNARYGTDRHNVDVTNRLQQLASRDSQFRITNDLFGDDPDVGARKVLRIYARDQRGGARTFEYGEFSYVDGAVFTGWGSGNWGNPGVPANWDGNGVAGDQGQYTILGARWGTAQRNVDVTERLKVLARRDARFAVANATFGDDPDVGARKTLRIYARGPDGVARTFEYGEGGSVDGAQFVGWSGGNWGHGGHDRWESGNVQQR